MRNNLIFLLFILAGICSCKKETPPVFDKSPDERINDTLSHYQQVLTGAPYGWRALVYPAGVPGSVYSFYFSFSDANRVQMFSDFDAASTNNVHESSWRLKALQQPSLLFDTYSYLHVLCDPDASHNGGVYGNGLGSDFEFAINGAQGDSVWLTGRFHRSKAILIKATQQDQENYLQHRINRSIDSIGALLTYFHRLSTSSGDYDVSINQYLHWITFTWIADGKPQQVTTGYTYTSTGIALIPAFKANNMTISSLDQVKWENGAIAFSINGKPATIANTATPLVIDPAAAQRWYQYAAQNEKYWITANGFHADGKDDACHITGLPNYAFLTYYPQINGPGTSLDLLGFVIKQDNGKNSIEFGPGYSAPSFTTDGRIIFNDDGFYGDPSDYVPAVQKTRALMADPQGFYLVQTSTSTFDMVNARDGKSWISWQTF
ncbi:DUF4302 domain-containing protein [Chitinophaga polysaccharea]|uniref:DUF4302 domain-containing protein n=1 Tax=Chitinophaga polysaccharea TaxID=1293035 RepID=UPI0014551800|nr:DUF4302 domain-containing protein [Chitinophaga polysaccharea]NLR59501.1 DUF4302 domain-containing protein [Chitinophaga polysaccharea]